MNLLKPFQREENAAIREEAALATSFLTHPFWVNFRVELENMREHALADLKAGKPGFLEPLAQRYKNICEVTEQLERFPQSVAEQGE